jgi:hypothetical protein
LVEPAEDTDDVPPVIGDHGDLPVHQGGEFLRHPGADSSEAGSGASGTDLRAQTIRLRIKRQNDISSEIMFK